MNSLTSFYKLDSEVDVNNWGGLINKSSLIDLGEKIIRVSEGKITDAPLKAGFNSLNVSYSDLMSKLNNPYLKGKYLTAVGKTEWDTLRWDGSPGEKRHIINSAQFIFCASRTVEDALKAKASLVSQTVNSKLLHCSDAHTYLKDISNTNPKEIGHCFNWDKADTTFEGLKQILYEPLDRLKIQKDEPDFKEDRLIIDEVRFISSDGTFSSNSICFNKNLNVIIGGKSSGKSVLLYAIAKTLLANRNFLRKEGIEEKYKTIGGQGKNFDFEVKTKGGFVQKMNRLESENSIIPEIKYIPQNYLIKLAEPEENKKGNELNKIIRDLITEDPQSLIIYNLFLSKVKAYDKKRETIIDNYFEFRDRILDLENQLKQKANIEILEKNIETNILRVEELNKSVGMTSEEIKKYSNLESKLEEKKNEFSELSDDIKRISNFNNDTIEVLKKLIDGKKTLSKILNNPLVKENFDLNYEGLDAFINQLKLFSSQFEFNEESKITGIVENILKEQEDIEKEISPYLKNEEVKKQIEEINKSISNEKNILSSIKHIIKEISECKLKLAQEKENLFHLYKETYKEYLAVIDNLKIRTDILEKKVLQIEGFVKFNFPRLREKIVEFSDGRTASYKLYNIFSQEKDALYNYNIDEVILDLRKVFEAMLETNEYILVSRVDKKPLIKSLLKDYFFDYWQVSYKNDIVGEMSAGKASFVILMLIIGLSNSRAPILIDQPEDNLDNRSITSELVEYLRAKKLERQIILVTHNPNIVVNADAENIIIAHQKGQGEIETTSPFQFDYINGSLENTKSLNLDESDILKSMGIREHIAEIVEGGKEAFKKRELKYGF